MQSMTLKQHQRWQYIRLCQAYNRCHTSDPAFITLSVQLHAAKGGEYIPKFWMRPCFVLRCGKGE